LVRDGDGSHFIRNDAILGRIRLRILCPKTCTKNKKDEQDSGIFHLGLRHTGYAELELSPRSMSDIGINRRQHNMFDMPEWRWIAPIARALFVSVLVMTSASPQTKRTRYPLTQFNNEGCMAKGRVQDCDGPVMHQIRADGKTAIPILISQLTETARTKYQIVDYWGDTRSGDVAYVVLNDLFTDTGSHFGMPDVPNWSVVMKGCNNSAASCWDKYLHKNSRLSVQQAWMRAWKRNKQRIHWDNQEQCFRVSKT